MKFLWKERVSARGQRSRSRTAKITRRRRLNNVKEEKKPVFSIASGCKNFVAYANYQRVQMVIGIMEMSNWNA